MRHVRGRLAPSPSGRMHLGNAFSALLAWLDVRSRGGELVLRLEDLDTDRCRREYSAVLEQDLEWLGLSHDIGGSRGGDEFFQSNRSQIYAEHLERLEAMGLVYPCFCTRAERMAASAPHASDGRLIYTGACRALTPDEVLQKSQLRTPALRLAVEDVSITVEDGVYGTFNQNLRRDCGDIILRRSDGVHAYQLAVVIDDALMGITDVVRGCDLLSSTPVQVYLHRLLGFEPPEFMHLPLLLAPDGKRLAKRERHLDMGKLRESFTAAELVGYLAHLAGLIPKPESVMPHELIPHFSRDKIRSENITVPPELCQEMI